MRLASGDVVRVAYGNPDEIDRILVRYEMVGVRLHPGGAGDEDR